MTEWKREKEERARRTEDRDERARARARLRCTEGGLHAHRAWFSNLALGLMSLFIQLWYQTFPFPARRSPLWRTALLGSSFPLDVLVTPVCRPKGKELERPQECSLKWYSSATWGEDEIAVKDLFPGWGIFFPSQVNVALNKGVTWMRQGSDVLGYLRVCVVGWGSTVPSRSISSFWRPGERGNAPARVGGQSVAPATESCKSVSAKQSLVATYQTFKAEQQTELEWIGGDNIHNQIGSFNFPWGL